VVQVRKHSEIRDPRCDERTGSFNEGLFKKSYAFLDEMKRSEKQLVQREAKKARNPEKRAKLGGFQQGRSNLGRHNCHQMTD